MNTNQNHLLDSAASHAVDAKLEAGPSCKPDDEETRSKIGLALTEAAESAEHIARNGVDAVRAGAETMLESGEAFVRKRPLQAMLLAAGVGAAMAIVIRSFARHRGGSL